MSCNCGGCSDCPEVKVLELKGEDGLTPYIGENGNWYIGDTDTGRSASCFYMTEVVLDRTALHNLFGTPFVITPATLGIDASSLAYPVIVELTVNNDGDAFAGSSVLTLEGTALLPVLSKNGYYISDSFNTARDVSLNTGFNIVASNPITGGGPNAEVRLTVFYKIKNV